MLKNKLITILICALNFECTFGSVGDVNAEKLIILQNLLTFRNNQTVILSTSLQFFDNQADDDLSKFTLTSAGNDYNISISSDSYVNWQVGSYRINPPERILGVLDARESKVDLITQLPGTLKTHTPYTVPLDLPTTDIYGKTYSFLNAQKEISLTANNSVNETGAAYSSISVKRIPDSPTGLISLATLTWEDFYLNVTITRLATTRTVKILLGSGTLILKPKCKIKIDGARIKPVSIGIVYSNLFRDYIENSVNVSFLQSVLNLAGPEIIVTSISNKDLFDNLQKNIKSEDLVINFSGCTPGAEK